MPIYEFKCLNCGEIVEFLFTSSDDQQEVKCPACAHDELERVLSTTNFSIASGGGKSHSHTQATTKSCGEGSCTTLEIPGLGD